MSMLRWGLIGASDVAATRMIPSMRRRGHEVVAVWSLSDEHAEAYASTHGIPSHTSSMDELVAREDIDAVYISTINRVHAANTLTAAAAGKHVLCEKPIALSLADGWSMIEACKAAGVVLAVNHHLPCAATHSEVQRLVASGAVGRPLAVRVFHAVKLPERLQTWRLQDRASGGGVILDITCHDASVINRLVGRPLAAAALGVNQGRWEATVEDAVMSVIQYEDDVLAQTHDAFTVPYANTGLEVHGSDGSVAATGVMTQDPVGDVVVRDGSGTHEIDIPHRPDLYDVSVEAFAGAVAGQGEPRVSGVQGVHALAVALAVQDAVLNGRSTPVVTDPVTVS
jgi:1,5-anhydro-D-fructose reductase (1,5-anhydro-D-mannitol-forming)